MFKADLPTRVEQVCPMVCVLRLLGPAGGRASLPSFSDSFRICEDEHAVVVLLGVESLALPHKDQSRTSGDTDNSSDQSCNESHQAVDDDKEDNSADYRSCCPIDVTPLQSHELQGLLKSLEQWVDGVTAVLF